MTTLTLPDSNLILPPSILNLEKVYSSNPGSLFLQGGHGLVDSINRPHQRLFDLYKELKALDWDEHEFELERCQIEFKTKPAHLCFKMIQTLAWQWEADSAVAHAITPVAAPFVSSDDLWLAYLRINENEGLHALSYSEIVKYGLGDSAQVLLDVVNNHQAAHRLASVAKALHHVKMVGAKLTLGMIDTESDEAIDAAMLFAAAMLVLERMQFMISFAATFAIGETGSFMPIVDTVQKILTDEYTIHIPVGKYVIRNELQQSRSKKSIDRIWPLIEKMIGEVLSAETDWNYNHLFADGKELAGIRPKMFEDWALFSANDVFETFGKPNPFRIVDKNPLSYMNDWIDINKNQGSPQETRRGNYLLGGVVQGDDDSDLDISDI